jgi:hypothetical protein
VKPVDRTGQVWKNNVTATVCLIVRSEHKVSDERLENLHQIIVLDGEAPRKFWYEDDGTSSWEINGSMTRLL